jgi:hypothetical protein
MDSNPAPSKLGKHGGKRVKGERACNTRLVYGTVAYWLARLERAQRHDLIAGIKGRRISAHSAAIQMGWIKRRPTLAGDDCNQARRREHAMTQVLDRATAIPCFNCRELCAWRALAEIADGYLRARKGEPLRSRDGITLPLACCRRQKTPVIEALIG